MEVVDVALGHAPLDLGHMGHPEGCFLRDNFVFVLRFLIICHFFVTIFPFP